MTRLNSRKTLSNSRAISTTSANSKETLKRLSSNRSGSKTLWRSFCLQANRPPKSLTCFKSSRNSDASLKASTKLSNNAKKKTLVMQRTSRNSQASTANSEPCTRNKRNSKKTSCSNKPKTQKSKLETRRFKSPPDSNANRKRRSRTSSQVYSERMIAFTR